MSKSIRFNRDDLSFTKELNRRVNEYFKDNHVSKHANSLMIFKTVVMFSLYWIPYTLILFNFLPNVGLYTMYALMGLGMAGIGFSVMHDANHGAYSKNPKVNRILGYTLNMLGGNATNWKIQHNVKHHTYTNVIDHDEDISPRGLFRFTPHTKRKKVHKYQHIYAWFFYSFMSLSWIIMKDYIQLTGYNKDGMLKKQGITKTKAWIWLISTKSFYFGYLFLVPLLITDYSFLQLLLGFVVIHLVAGFFLAIVFQPAHVIDGTEFPTPDGEGVINDEWAALQLKTTSNFASKSTLFSFFVGGLNFQIEHHLFPTVCHVHYKNISGIVESTAKEYNLPYHNHKTFAGALYYHAKLLKFLGRNT